MHARAKPRISRHRIPPEPGSLPGDSIVSFSLAIRIFFIYWPSLLREKETAIILIMGQILIFQWFFVCFFLNLWNFFFSVRRDD